MAENNTQNENETTAEKQTEDVLPQWARDEITKANNQAAKYRTEKNDAVEAAKKEVSDSFSEKISELEAQIEQEKGEAGSARTEVDRIKAALGVGIEQSKVLSFAELLKGDTPDELASHAEELKGLFTTEDSQKSTRKATDPSQGTGNTTPLNGDPLLNALMSAVNR